MSIFKNSDDDFSDLTVLLVEDNAFEQKLARLSLQELGFETVVTASNGKEALDKLEKYAGINLVVSDWNMPTMNGLELLERVRELFPDMPFVMLTGNNFEDQVADAKKAGIFAYVLKPFTLEILRQKITAVVRNVD